MHLTKFFRNPTGKYPPHEFGYCSSGIGHQLAISCFTRLGELRAEPCKTLFPNTLITENL